MIKKNEVMKNLLSAIGEFVVLFPKLFIRESMYYKDLRVGGFDPKKLERTFRNLRYRGLITADREKLQFTKKGESWFQNSYQKFFKFEAPAKDGKWRIIIFDIPQEHNKSRNKFRYKLKLWGFYMLQYSVFVCPYACEKEVAEICEKLNISDHVDIILADSPGFREKEIQAHFKNL